MSIGEIRDALSTNTDGLTVAEIAQIAGLCHKRIAARLSNMPDCYIDRWQPSKRGPKKWVAVYIRIAVPANTPRPE